MTPSPAAPSRDDAERLLEEDGLEAAWRDAGYESSFAVWQAEGR